MASYGNIFRYLFDSKNGWHFEITIAKKGYTGEVFARSLGRAPLLRRDNNSGIYGTSLEIYAECRTPGEYAQLYTSSAYEYQVQLYRNGANLWTGFLTPELYSEPDRPAPYDVRLVATDGLGELKRFKFYSQGARTLRYHLESILSYTGVGRAIVLLSTLSYDTGSAMSTPPALLDLVIDLSHEDGNKCYDVLQNILASLHAGISLQNNTWFLFRPTDFIQKAAPTGLLVYGSNNTLIWPIAQFGSFRSKKWWPVGNMSMTVEPAKNGVELTAPFYYKENMLGSWTLGNSAAYDSAENADLLSGKDSYMVNNVSFNGEEIAYKLLLSIKARNVGAGGGQNLGVKIKADAHIASGYYTMYLNQVSRSDGTTYLQWTAAESIIDIPLAAPNEYNTASEAENVELLIPLYDNRKDNVNTRSWIYARAIEITLLNPQGICNIYVYDVSLTAYDQADGAKADFNINNGAREKASAVDLKMTDGATMPAGGRWSMSGVPYTSSARIITEWFKAGMEEPGSYLDMMAQDYAQAIGAARLHYSGRLNVPYGENLPVLYYRDGTYYFPRTYSYDLYNDEMEVDMVSIPDANVDIDFN